MNQCPAKGSRIIVKRSDAAIDYVLERLDQEVQKRFSALGGEMDAMRRRKAVLESEVKNLA